MIDGVDGVAVDLADPPRQVFLAHAHPVRVVPGQGVQGGAEFRPPAAREGRVLVDGAGGGDRGVGAAAHLVDPPDNAALGVVPLGSGVPLRADVKRRFAVPAPFGQVWPGLAASRETVTNPEQLASEFAEAFLTDCPRTGLGLVAAPSGAEALTAMGWAGPCNYENDTAKFSAVVRDWENRFGARVVAVGFSTLHLSIAAPPVSEHEALLVAAEHFAFCPDNIWQGSRPYTLAAYAERITGAQRWDFWWD
ncbi:DUF4253 domain-containing protein [Streptomyces sp. RerS4]|uniref:DUF4253 domain-containing protein n=1 Tax=Streptomyces sp. RerS4 TaxID=2942449 RepID=UPI00201CA144|nr:DUF4253 domain-containing protein [Streptomyces sp. RerS4]UQX04701.1 DUF4253 domain-containing protein [Streptomyces sp. RerS4]